MTVMTRAVLAPLAAHSAAGEPAPGEGDRAGRGVTDQGVTERGQGVTAADRGETGRGQSAGAGGPTATLMKVRFNIVHLEVY